jgi:hypothetical protein
MKYPNIKKEMGRNHFTLSKLALSLDLPASSVMFKLEGKQEFTLSEIEQIAALFHCSLDYLVGHQAPPAKEGEKTPVLVSRGDPAGYKK